MIAQRSSALDSGTVGVAVMDLSSGEWMYKNNAETQFNSASNTKLVTTAAALALLGPDFTYQTAVFSEGVESDGSIRGDIYFRGRGDPLLGVDDLRRMARELRVSGIKKVRGGVVVDSSYFDQMDSPPHFDEQPKEQASFRAPIGASAVGFNMYTMIVSPAAGGRGPASVTIEPPNDYIELTAQVQTVSTGRSRLRIKSTTRKRSLEVQIVGQVRRESGTRTYRRRIPDPSQFAGSVFRRALIEQRISVGSSRIKEGTVPTSTTMLTSHTSLPVASLVRGLGKYSNNFMAEVLLKTIGAETLESARPATWEDGLGAVRNYLENQVGLKAGSYRYGNGSGLFDSNRFTPAQLAQVLAVAYKDFRYGPDLVSSLSIAGADGTLRRRMVDSVAERQVRAKTGTLDQVSALSGYAATYGRPPVAFSVLVNDFPKGNASDMRSLQDDVAEAVVEYLESAR